MAPTTVVVAAAPGCLSMLQSSEPPEVVGSGRRRLSLDSWVCLPILRPVRTSSTTTSSSSQVSSSGSSCTTHKDSLSKDPQQPQQPQPQSQHQQPQQPQQLKTLTLEVPSDDLETGCETPKSKEHRIPDVDVTFCPPAPRKPRAMARRRRVQPTSFFNTPDFENFLSQHKVQVLS